jgi:plasmid maintenance system antidote protein VapI
MNIGICIKIALAKSQKDTTWLANQLGVSQTRAGNIVRATNVNSDTINKLAAVFGMKPSEFIALGE